MSDSDMIQLPLAGFTPSSLKERVFQAHIFHREFLSTLQNHETGLYILQMPQWGEKLIRRSGGIPQAVLEKLGSNNFSKRRPENSAPFLSYIEKCYDAQAPLHLRLVVGPVKNVLQCGAYQAPDLAEYLMFIQLIKLMDAIAPLYPFGIKVQMVPDDMRGWKANRWPHVYGRQYISGLRKMAADLQIDTWLDVEDGQARLYEQYEVKKYIAPAEKAVPLDADYEQNFAQACIKARQNFVAYDAQEVSESEVRASAMRYLISYKAEILSGMWSPEDALPLIYANHPGNFQLYTMGPGLTKLPWQIRLPFTLLSTAEPKIMPVRGPYIQNPRCHDKEMALND